MGDIKLQVMTHDKLRALIDDSRNQIDLFAHKWGDLTKHIPRANILHSYDDLTNVLGSIKAEVSLRKNTSLHGYDASRFGMLNFEEIRGVHAQYNMSKSSNYDNSTNMNMIQHDGSYNSNNVNVNMIQQGNVKIMNNGSNNYNDANIIHQKNFQAMNQSGNNYNDAQGNFKLMTQSGNNSTHNINTIINDHREL